MTQHLIKVSYLKAYIAHDEKCQLDKDRRVVILLTDDHVKECYEDTEEDNAVHGYSRPVLYVSHES